MVHKKWQDNPMPFQEKQFLVVWLKIKKWCTAYPICFWVYSRFDRRNIYVPNFIGRTVFNFHQSRKLAYYLSSVLEYWYGTHI